VPTPSTVDSVWEQYETVRYVTACYYAKKVMRTEPLSVFWEIAVCISNENGEKKTGSAAT